MSVLIIIQNHAEFLNTLIRTLMRSKDNVTIFGLIKDCCICVHMHCKLLEKKMRTSLIQYMYVMVRTDNYI